MPKRLSLRRFRRGEKRKLNTKVHDRKLPQWVAHRYQLIRLVRNGLSVLAAGSQVALMESTAAALAANPPFCDLTQAEVSQIINWPGVTRRCVFLPQLVR